MDGWVVLLNLRSYGKSGGGVKLRAACLLTQALISPSVDRVGIKKYIQILTEEYISAAISKDASCDIL